MLNLSVAFPSKSGAPSAAYPYGSARNVTTPGDGTGTPWDEAVLADFLGLQQTIIGDAGVVPTNVPDEVGACQVYQAMLDNMSPVGTWLPASFNDTPANLGLRLLKLDGSGVLIASYPELDARAWVGSGANAAQAAADGGYYRASDSAGTTPDVAGPYLILPDVEGRFVRGDDPSSKLDPDAPRLPATPQAGAFQAHSHEVREAITSGDLMWRSPLLYQAGASSIEVLSDVNTGLKTFAAEDAIEPFIAYSEDETRPANINAGWFVRY